MPWFTFKSKVTHTCGCFITPFALNGERKCISRHFQQNSRSFFFCSAAVHLLSLFFMSSSSHYHFSAIAAVASIAIASLALTTTTNSTCSITKKSLRLSKSTSVFITNIYDILNSLCTRSFFWKGHKTGWTLFRFSSFYHQGKLLLYYYSGLLTWRKREMLNAWHTCYRRWLLWFLFNRIW